MSDFESYEVIDFAMDARFQRWVRKESTGEEGFWYQWAAGRPERKQILEEATRLVQVLDAGKESIEKSELEKQWEILQQLINHNPMPFSNRD